MPTAAWTAGGRVNMSGMWRAFRHARFKGRLQPQINAQPTAPDTNTDAAIRPAAANTDAGTHSGLNRFAISSAPGKGRSGCNQQYHSQYPHHTNAFHRLIWART